MDGHKNTNDSDNYHDETYTATMICQINFY